MRRLIIVEIMALVLVGCRTTSNVVERDVVRTEYKTHVDSVRVFERDSVFFMVKGETLVHKVYQWRYRDRYVTDTLIKNDTVRMNNRVVETRTVSKMSSIQSFLAWSGGVLWLLLVMWIVLKFVVRR